MEAVQLTATSMAYRLRTHPPQSERYVYRPACPDCLYRARLADACNFQMFALAYVALHTHTHIYILCPCSFAELRALRQYSRRKMSLGRKVTLLSRAWRSPVSE